MRLRGFTFIEIMAVVSLIGLLAAGTAWSLAGQVQQATRAEVLDRLKNADAAARLAARRLGPSALRIDLDQQRLWIVRPDATSSEPAPGHSMQLPEGFRIAQVSWIDPTPRTRPGTRPRKRITHSSGVLELPISSAGLSRTYVMQLVGPPSEERADAGETEQTTWLLVSGLTGQVSLEDDTQAIDNLLDLLASTRPDTD